MKDIPTRLLAPALPSASSLQIDIREEQQARALRIFLKGYIVLLDVKSSIQLARLQSFF